MASTSKGPKSASTADPAKPESSVDLTSEQLHALFDILTHHETYAEIEAFKYPDTITSYGYPFKSETTIPSALPKSGTSTPATGRSRSRSPLPPSTKTATSESPSQDASQDVETGTSPVLQTLFTRFVLPLPWLRDLPRDFWSVRMQGLLWRLAGSDLSESYDKGALGLRKTLATGASSLIELVGRGALGGVSKQAAPATPSASEVLKQNEKTGTDEDKTGYEGKPAKSTEESKFGGEEYDLDKAEDLERAWDDFVQQLVHGDLVPEMFEYMRHTDDLEGYSPTMRATSEYTILHMATFMHHIFITSPEGAYLLSLLRNVHNLIPYKMVKQTLRIGNAATMINGMIRLLLAKLSVGGITNWMGLTTNADDGMNLLQRIIALVLQWDSDVFKKGADKISKDGEVPDEVLKGLKDFVDNEERMKHDAVREQSRTSAQSIVFSALNATDQTDLAASLDEQAHSQALSYYSSILSVRDRSALTDVLCKSQPDLFTSIVRELVASYEPFIRMLHQGVDLREYLEAVQEFIDEFIKASEKKDGKEATVKDYVELLRRNKGLMYRWIHAVAGNCEEVWGELEKWSKKVVVKFQKSEERGDMNGRLRDLYSSLPEGKRSAVGKTLDEHAKYLSTLEDASRKNMQALLTSDSKDSPGPGIYLSRWQHLLDTTPITPELPVGPVRKGRDVKHTLAMGKGNIVGEKTADDGKGEQNAKKTETLETEAESAPDVSVVVTEMGDGFQDILKDIGGPDF